MFNEKKLSISPIAWTNDDDPNLGGHISFEQCIFEMQQAGFHGTELGSKYPRDANVLKQKLAEHQLQLSSAWFSAFFTDPNLYNKTIDDFFEHASFLKNSGASIINICECTKSIQQSAMPIFSNYKPLLNELQWQRLIDGLHEIGRIARSINMQLSYHFHLGTVVQNQDEVEFLMENTATDLVGLLLDSGHAYAANIDMHKLIDKYGARINLLHLKDVRFDILQKAKNNNLSFMDAVRAGLFTVPGDGCIDFNSLYTKLNNLNYQGWTVVEAEQDPAIANPLIYAKKARKFLLELS